MNDAEALMRFTTSLEHFKDWSNFLLVTTVAALGWTASKDQAFRKCTRPLCVLLFALSTVFAIFTLALIPLVAEQGHGYPSIYDVPVTFWMTEWIGVIHLKFVCMPQHLLFIAGIILYAGGTVGMKPVVPVQEGEFGR